MGIIDDIKLRYNQGGMLLRLIYINIGVFLLLHVASIIAWLFGVEEAKVLLWVETPSRLGELVYRPWTVITYCFSHYELLHILFNLLWLYWLGRIFLEFFTAKHLSGLYILGGIGGAVLYVLAYNCLPALIVQRGYLIGASASVIAIVVAVATYVPNYKIGLLFLGDVSLKWIAVAMVIMSLLGIGASNTGGDIAHLGGALVGFWFAYSFKRGRDITRWINASLDGLMSLFRRKRSAGVGQPTGGTAYHDNRRNQSEPTEADLDRVLDKIRRSGYSSLTDDERDILFRASQKR
ncbi:MAG: rhomboid family intramembrane serine protease [Muribaculaceae bacterium]|nr:rhomboid family intramembrane serine protease [Muribaculaceae bacterium]